MAFPLAAGIGLQAAGSLLGGLFGDDAAEERERALGEAITTVDRGYDRAGEFLDPRLDQERSAMGRVNSLLGLSGEDPDYDLFRDSPGYQFQLEQGQQAIERSAAARGGLQSGNTLAEVTRFGQGLADTTFNNYLAQVMGLQNQGVDFARANLETGRASNIANLTVGQGEARASGVESVGNALIGGLEGIGGLVTERNRTNALLDSGVIQRPRRPIGRVISGGY